MLAKDKAPPSANLPNIVFIMVDQMRGDAMGCSGNPIVQTPNLDRLASSGALFLRAYSSTPACKPARAALLSGLSPWRHGALSHVNQAPEYPHEPLSLLRSRGYYCMGIGKMHFFPRDNKHAYHQIQYDFAATKDYVWWFRAQAPGLEVDSTGLDANDYRQRYYGHETRLNVVRWTGDRAVDFIENYPKNVERENQPFFLKVSFTKPHSPYDAPKEYCEFYEKNRDKIPPRALGDWCGENARQGEALPNDLHRGDLGPEAPTQAKIGYYGNITFIDDEIGRILDALRKKGLLDNTLILFTSDHGDMLGDHHLWRKSRPYEGSARVPMVVWWGEKLGMENRRGIQLSNPVELRDVPISFLDAAGASFRDEWYDGRSLLALIRDPGCEWRPYLDLEFAKAYERGNSWSALTDGRMKYIFHGRSGEEQLFDLTRDPQELRNLAHVQEYRETLLLWRERLVRFLAPRGEDYVREGKLVYPRDAKDFSPNFPKKPSKERETIR
ncbi:MAG: arylsulfatase [Planctomycetia bacterium]|nr:arylsulfatase [Planctomycetia bacterium]